VQQTHLIQISLVRVLDVNIGAIIQISLVYAGLEQQMPHTQISLELKLVITQR
jgi:hypothetical protein